MPVVAAGWIVVCLALTTGCAQNMRDQVRLKPYEESQFFPNSASARELVPNTVAQGQLRTDEHFYTGMTGGAAEPGGTAEAAGTAEAGGTAGGGGSGQAGGNAQTGATAQPGTDQGSTGTIVGTAEAGATAQPEATLQAAAGQGRPDLVDTFPFEVTGATLERGRGQYNAFCAPCHALTGYGDGMIVQRGFQQPPSFHQQRLRDAPVGHFFDVITNGFGTMYPYASRIAPEDRWAIVAYIRALQLSQNATIEDVPPESRQQLEGTAP